MSLNEVNVEVRKHPTDSDWIEIYSQNRFGARVMWGILHSDILPDGVDYGKCDEFKARLVFEEGE